jgi:probable rRNA maturation factor
MLVTIEELVVDRKKILGDTSVIFCSDEYLLEMNVEHLSHDYYTDIITFDYCEGEIISGDIFISVDRVRENARNYKVKYENEIVRVVGHGFLHLLGFGDKTEEESGEMRKMENIVIENYFR